MIVSVSADDTVRVWNAHSGEQRATLTGQRSWGEPEWVPIPAGEFWMGSEKGRSNEKPRHRVRLPKYKIARVPVTNAQYALYVADQQVNPPSNWRGGQPQPGEENHPVVSVSWYDAQGYCRWLSKNLGKEVRLPTETE